MNLHRTLILTATMISCLANQTSAQTPQHWNQANAHDATAVHDRSSQDMDSLLQSFVDEQKVNAVAAYVAQGGEVLYHKAFGWKDLEHTTLATVDDYYVLFSQTKAITTVAFMTLVEQGLVSIDDPVSKFFPGIPYQVVTAVHEDGSYETRPASTPMTFVHLMSHTSGLGAGLVRDIRRAQGKPGDAPAGFGGAIPENPPAGQRTGGVNPLSQYLEEEMLALAAYPLGFDPGSRWEYHISTNMLAYLIERISGKPLRDYVKEQILIPLGMDNTDWFYEPEALDRFVKACRYADGKLHPGPGLYSEATVLKPHTYAEGAIGLNGPIKDYARFCQMLLNKGTLDGQQILKPETVELMTHINRLPPAGENDDGFRFGLGFELHQHKKPSAVVSDSAFAWGGMFGTGYIIDPGHDLIALFYINIIGPEPMYPRFLEQAYQLAGVGMPAEGSQVPPGIAVVEDGGTGPFPAIVTEDPSLQGITIYRPRDLAPFSEDDPLPVLLWGNGACANTTQEHKNFLNELSSHGYLVLGIGRLDQIHERDERSREPTRSAQLLEALDWITAENNRPGSAYHGKIALSRVAAMGMSCGGLQAIEVSADPRITTSIVCNSGILPGPSPMRLMPQLDKDYLRHFHGPVLYILGGPSDIAYANGMDDFQRLNHVPVVVTNLDVGHGGTYQEAHGGAFTPVALAWLDWHLKDRDPAAAMFLGETSTLANDPLWTIEVKGF
jgi:CubicO group peptidase (beta-lactamase class C family)